MEIVLIGYICYACAILIWCSLSEASCEFVLLPIALLEEWSVSRHDLIVFELVPEGSRPPPSFAIHNVLLVTPSTLEGLMDWAPPGSTLVFCNCGVSFRSILRIRQKLAGKGIFRAYWLDSADAEPAVRDPGASAHKSSGRRL